MKVDFVDLDKADDKLLTYAVIVSRYKGKWIYCKHRNRETWEIPGGRREAGEAILFTAKRELHEETGAVEYELHPICAYSVASGAEIYYGFLCCADITNLGQLPESEIERISFFDDEPDSLTYPLIQPFLFAKAKQYLEKSTIVSVRE